MLPTDRTKVLLIEDDEDDFILTRDLLFEIDESRFELEWATTYANGLEKILNSAYDICLLDYRLGSNTGLDLLREAKNSNCSIPIILLTGQGDHEIDIEAMKAGAADYLVKGELNAALLERSIRYTVAQNRIEQERAQHFREQEARVQAEAANKAKDEFLAMVSHELRTPLNVMLGWVQLLRMHKGDEATFDRAVETIERNVRLQAKFVEDLLDITRVVHGNLRLEHHPIRPVAAVESAIDGIRPAADEKQLHIETDLTDCGQTISGDPARIQQVLNNILTNAIKFTPKGGRIEVSAECIDSDVKISITDSGKGIKPELLPIIFERYRQADDSTGNHGGLGLGLAIARNLVELHGGTITAESEGLNQGATFTITLPLADGADQ